MYKCDDCGAVFSEPDTKQYTEGIIGYCPQCGSTDYDTVNICKCGNPCTGINEWCDSCLDEIGTALRDFMYDKNINSDELGGLVAEYMGW